jgi:hypothetical protein
VEEMEREGAWVRAQVRDAARCRRPCMAAAAAAAAVGRGRGRVGTRDGRTGAVGIVSLLVLGCLVRKSKESVTKMRRLR